MQAVARNAAAQSVPPGVVDLIAAAQREIDAASASAEQLIRENDFAEDGLDLDFDAFLDSDGIAELVAQAQATVGPLPVVQHTPSRSNVHARRGRSPVMSQASPAVTPVRKTAGESAAVTSSPVSPPQNIPSAAPAIAEDAAAVAAAVPAAVKATPAQPTAVPATAQPEVATTGAAPGTTAAAGTPAPSTAGTTAGVKELPKGNAKQKRAHKNADAIR